MLNNSVNNMEHSNMKLSECLGPAIIMIQGAGADTVIFVFIPGRLQERGLEGFTTLDAERVPACTAARCRQVYVC